MKTANDYLGSLVDTLCLGPAVYFLFMDDEVVYIGSSITPLGRISYHFGKNAGRFNRAKLIPTDRKDLISVENECIGLFNPKYNFRGISGEHSPDRPNWISRNDNGTKAIGLEMPAELIGRLEERAKELGITKTEAIKQSILLHLERPLDDRLPKISNFLYPDG